MKNAKNLLKAISCLDKVAQTKFEQKPGIEKVNVGDTIYYQSAVGGYKYGEVAGIYPSGTIRLEVDEGGQKSLVEVYRDQRFNVFYEFSGAQVK